MLCRLRCRSMWWRKQESVSTARWSRNGVSWNTNSVSWNLKSVQVHFPKKNNLPQRERLVEQIHQIEQIVKPAPQRFKERTITIMNRTKLCLKHLMYILLTSSKILHLYYSVLALFLPHPLHSTWIRLSPPILIMYSWPTDRKVQTRTKFFSSQKKTHVVYEW